MNQLIAILNNVLRSEVNSVAMQRPEWPSDDTDERYLAEATDHADLERRMRVLDREHQVPQFVTFNH